MKTKISRGFERRGERNEWTAGDRSEDSDWGPFFFEQVDKMKVPSSGTWKRRLVEIFRGPSSRSDAGESRSVEMC